MRIEMANKKITYEEISSAKVTDKRNVVISSCSRGGYTIAQQVTVEEGSTETKLFMKGAIRVDSVDGLKALRDAITVAITEAETWDETPADAEIAEND